MKALVGVFVILVSVIIGPRLPVHLDTFTVLLSVGVVFALLGVVLLFLTVKTKVRGILKIFLLLTGASAVGLPIFVLLHNVVYMLSIMWFGEGTFGNGDEAVFFIMALFVCPICFLIGAVGTIMLAIKSKQVKQSSQD